MHPGTIGQAINLAGPATGERRSARICWHMPVIATWNTSGALKPVIVREQGETVDVSAHGALLKLHCSLGLGHRIKIIRPGSPLCVQARVVRNLGMDAQGLTQLAVEVEEPSLDFWVQMAL